MSHEPEPWPLVSVIVPTRGRPDLVRETLSAIVGQTYPGPIECIVVHEQEPPRPELAELGAPRRSVQGRQPQVGGPGGRARRGCCRGPGRILRQLRRRRPWHPTKVRRQV